LSKRLSKYLHHNKSLEENKIPKVEDINVDSEVLGDMSMETIVKLAVKATKPGSALKPIDRIVMFLQKQKDAMHVKEEK
jgi:hypothetical protein